MHKLGEINEKSDEKKRIILCLQRKTPAFLFADMQGRYAILSASEIERIIVKSKRTLLLGLTCGIVCAVSVFLYTGTVKAEASADREEMLARYGGEQIEACVATRDIAAGETVSASNVSQKTWITQLLPEEAVLLSDDAIGKKATSSISKGEVVTAKRFASEDQSIDVPEGLSALSVPAKDVQAIGGSVHAGMKVDVYATGASATEVLAREVLVLATSTGESTNSSTAFSWITLALKNESVQELIAASQKTELYFVLPG